MNTIFETRTHACIDCRLQEQHSPEELCPSCGRCDVHCTEDNHERMTAMDDEQLRAHDRRGGREPR